MTESDYFHRQVEDGFKIEGVLSVSEDFGIRICLGQGDDQLLEHMQKANLVVCGFADNDGAKKERWAAIKKSMGHPSDSTTSHLLVGSVFTTAAT